MTHKPTGLTWKRCAEGMAWSSSSCTGTAATYTWAQAIALTATFAGQSDWRLPTIRELSTIAKMDAINPAINTTIFPNTSTSYFWSASADAGSSGRAWYVGFDYGFDGSSDKADALSVRRVRGGQPFGLKSPDHGLRGQWRWHRHPYADGADLEALRRRADLERFYL